MTKAADGTTLWSQRPAEELDRIGRVVRSAVGYDEKRGDKVDVVSLRFTADPDLADETPQPTLPFGLEKADLLRLLQMAVFGVLALLALMMVLRPMVRRLTASVSPGAIATTTDGGELRIADGRAAGDASIRSANSSAGNLPALAGPGREGSSNGSATNAFLQDESMVNIANVEGQLRASSIRRVADLVEKHPEESLSIVRAWMHQEAA